MTPNPFANWILEKDMNVSVEAFLVEVRSVFLRDWIRFGSIETINWIISGF